VLLIESGSEGNASDNEHASFFDVAAGPDRTYDLRVRRTAVSAISPYRVGRGIGGSSAINGMIGMFGLPDDYDRWERDSRLPRAGLGRRRASVRAPEHPRAPAAPSEWAVSMARWSLPRRSSGHRYPAEVLDPTSIGVGPAMLTRSGSRRVSSADAYLEPARDRPNLTIRANTTVDRIAMEGTRAVGVLTTDGEAIDAARSSSALGALHSPTLLLRSGVDLTGRRAGTEGAPVVRARVAPSESVG